MLLALDTATRQAGLALYDADGVRAETSWHAGRHHTEWLAPAVADTLRRIQAAASDLSAVAVTVGPGSFTGLRVALSLAKGIAAARALPLFGIPTLAVTAYPHLEQGHSLCVTLPAGRGRHAYAIYGAEATRATVQAHEVEPGLATVAGLALLLHEQADPDLLVVGELSEAERERLRANFPAVSLVAPALAMRRPAVLAELAWRRWQAGDPGDDPHSLAPFYLHLLATGAS